MQNQYVYDLVKESGRVPSLEEFMALPRGNSYVAFDGFKALYVRIGPRYVNDRLYPRVFEIANITAVVPGTGAFGRLITYMDREHMDIPIYVECVLNERFASRLIRTGWEPVSPSFSESYFRNLKRLSTGDLKTTTPTAPVQ